jgi:hypothetical protein
MHLKVLINAVSRTNAVAKKSERPSPTCLSMLKKAKVAFPTIQNEKPARQKEVGRRSTSF